MFRQADWEEVRIWFSFSFSFLIQVPSPSTMQHANEVTNFPHLTPIFPESQEEVRMLLSTAPGTESREVEQRGEKRQTLVRRRAEGGEERYGKEEREWSLGQGGGCSQ